MSILASQVKELRDISGVGMMECKKALVKTDGNLQKALDLLRANSSLKAEKKASRVAADGVIMIADNYAYSSLDGKDIWMGKGIGGGTLHFGLQYIDNIDKNYF